jgi:carbonic anhydrase/acetyltransferase-like protein (isoleucine patch superfamily)
LERDEFHVTRLTVPPSAWIAPGAVLAGDVTLGENSSVWFGCVLRGDVEPITVGSETNLQDLTVVHVDRGHPARIGSRVTVGHRCIVHGCTVSDDVLVGMGAVLLTGCRIGRGALIAAGSVVTEGFEVPEGTIAAGVPVKLRGPVAESLRERMRQGVANYVALKDAYRERRIVVGVVDPERSPRGGGA